MTKATKPATLQRQKSLTRISFSVSWRFGAEITVAEVTYPGQHVKLLVYLFVNSWRHNLHVRERVCDRMDTWNSKNRESLGKESVRVNRRIPNRDFDAI